MTYEGMTSHEIITKEGKWGITLENHSDLG